MADGMPTPSDGARILKELEELIEETFMLHAENPHVKPIHREK